MKRRLFILVAFLLIGAIVNVAVAWVCALTIDLYAQPPTSKTRFSPQRMHAVHVFSRFAGQAVYDQRSKIDPALSFLKTMPGIDPDDLIPAWSGFGKPSRRFIAATLPFQEIRAGEARGWPMLSMRWELLESSNQAHGGNTVPSAYIVGGIETPWKHTALYGITRSSVLGLRPIWPNFAINTIYYAAILWLLFAAPFALRRSIRRRRRIRGGLCPACAYPIGVSDVCTECGKPLPKRAGVAS